MDTMRLCQHATHWMPGVIQSEMYWSGIMFKAVGSHVSEHFSPSTLILKLLLVLATVNYPWTSDSGTGLPDPKQKTTYVV